MKKYLKLSIVTLCLIALCAFVPIMIGMMITPVELVAPKSLTISEDIYVNGIVEEIAKKDIFVELPIVPEQVNFQVGDSVNTHDVLATVDTSATQAAIFNLADSTKLIPEEYMEVLGNISISEDLLSGYIPTELTSPTSGIITAMNLQEGTMAVPKTLACTISKSDGMRIKMTVDELSADKLVADDTVVFKAQATGDVKYSGKVERIFPTATKTISGTSQVTSVGFYVTLDEDYSRLKPGYTINGVIKKESAEQALTIPYEAVLQDANNIEYVYIYEDAKAVRKNIVTGEEFYDKVAVETGLSPKDKVIKNATDIKNENTRVVCR